ncbi:MAG: SRPBCC family protein [Pseudomonadota bacterium]
MKDRSCQHATFVIERKYAASPARVFAAWADPAAKARWFNGPSAWQSKGYVLDFRVGGREHLRTGAPGGNVHQYDCVYQDIVPETRIIYSYDMHIGEVRISVSLATVEFQPDGSGTRMKFTEQAVFLDGYDDAGSRERGTQELLAKLGAALDAG